MVELRTLYVEHVPEKYGEKVGEFYYMGKNMM
jgi:hypothetical protein